MNKIDCLVIGHYETLIESDVKMSKSMGSKSCTYKELNYSYLKIDERAHAISDIFNLLSDDNKNSLNTGDTFSAVVAYLCTFLKRNNISCAYVNSLRANIEQFNKYMADNDILTIAITTTFYVSFEPIKEIIDLIRNANRKVKIILGGPFIANAFRKYSKDEFNDILELLGADYYIHSSQGEAALVNLINAIKFNLNVKDVANVYYSNHNEYCISKYIDEDNNLNDNFVDWNYFKDDIKHKIISMRTAISCPYSCSFCAYPIHSGKYRMMGIDKIEQELNILEGRVNRINFIDDTFNIPAERFKSILKMMIRQKYHFKWHSYLRCQYIDEETIGLMKESGCEGVFLGIESGNDDILMQMNKSAKIEKYQQGLNLLNKYDIISYASFIIGFPGETPKTVEDTINFIETFKPTFYRANLWFCDTQTPIYDKRSMFSLEGAQYEWTHNTMDSNAASELVKGTFLKVKNSTWLPLYNFDFQGIFHLLERGMSIENIKEFLGAFNEGLKEKLIFGESKNLSKDLVLKLKRGVLNNLN